jgi:hypothetical protein
MNAARFLNTYACPRCKETGIIPGIETSFNCPRCAAALRSNAIGAFVGAMFLGGLPIVLVGAFGEIESIVGVVASIAFTIFLWRVFLNVQLQNENDA